jgi:hypothetical protein
MRRARRASFAALCLWACSSPAVIGSTTEAPKEPIVEPNTTLTKVDAQDVTILYPLPKTLAEADRLPGGDTPGAFGELIPSDPFARIKEPLDARSKGPAGAVGDFARRGLRLVALRLDPCFGVLGKEPACKAQMRLVFQGLSAQGDGSVGADDGAVHVFVELPPAELLRAVRQVLTLREKSGGYAAAPLGVHPILEREGVAGAFAKGLRSVILEHAGASRVTRLTFFRRTLAKQSQWVFGIFDGKGGALAESPVATTGGQTRQELVAGIGDGLAGKVTNPTQAQDDLGLLLDTEKSRAATAAERQKAILAAQHVENPRIHSPDTIDCVSCHTATAALRVTRATFGSFPVAAPDAYVVTNLPPAYADAQAAGLENIHALGYLGSELGLNQRTANESHAVTVAVDALLAAP